MPHDSHLGGQRYAKQGSPEPPRRGQMREPMLANVSTGLANDGIIALPVCAMIYPSLLFTRQNRTTSMFLDQTDAACRPGVARLDTRPPPMRFTPNSARRGRR